MARSCLFSFQFNEKMLSYSGELAGHLKHRSKHQPFGVEHPKATGGPGSKKLFFICCSHEVKFFRCF